MIENLSREQIKAMFDALPFQPGELQEDSRLTALLKGEDWMQYNIVLILRSPGSDNLGMDRDEFRKVFPRMFNRVTHNFSL